jgi:hypothetical protein
MGRARHGRSVALRRTSVGIQALVHAIDVHDFISDFEENTNIINSNGVNSIHVFETKNLVRDGGRKTIQKGFDDIAHGERMASRTELSNTGTPFSDILDNTRTTVKSTKLSQ